MERTQRIGALGGWLVAALLSVPVPGLAQSLRTVPTDHWAYSIADEVLLRHPELGANLWHANRPWREADFRALLERAEEAGLSAPRREREGPGYRIIERGSEPVVAGWLEGLAEAFPPEPVAEDDLYYHNEVLVSGDVDVRAADATFEPSFLPPRFGDDVGEPMARAFAQHDFGIQFRSRFALGWRYALDSNVRNDPTRFRQEEIREGEEFGFAVLDAYGTAHWGPLWVTVGRNAFEWGPGRASSVFISDSIPPIDQARVELGTRHVRFTGIISRLSRDPQNRTIAESGRPISDSEPPESGLLDVDRLLYLHRVDWQPFPRLQLAIGEGALVTGLDRGLEVRYANLLVPFFITQKDDDETEETNVNVFGDVEVVVTLTGGVRLWGHLLAENINIEREKRERQRDQVAWRLGGEWGGPRGLPLTAGLEYTRVEVFMYLHRGLNTNWTQFGVPIGAMLGPDADTGLAWLSWWPRPTLRLTAEAMARRQGERRIDSVESTAESKPGFPSGTVQREWRLGLEAWTLLTRWGLEALGRLSVRDVSDVGHVPGSDDRFWRAFLGLRLRHVFR